MYSKIAVKNVKKSFKDYTIYFLTLTLAVAIFYSFNSIDSQKAIVEAMESGAEILNTITTVISYISVLVAIILGSLILYANNFLVKKRNKELGIYMTLGMGKAKISRILITETFMVGILSLISGLVIGLIASQGLSFVVAKLFEFNMESYKFVISPGAMGKTVLYFGIMFILVMIFNTYVISKYKIIDLLTMGRKNEEIKMKHPAIYVIIFLIGIAILGLAYKLILEVGLNIDNPKVLISIVLGITGTILFFFSLSGFLIDILKRSKGIYFKELNIFTVKQLNSKIRTNFLSMSVIALMLFLTMVTLSTGFSFKDAIVSGLKDSTPYDATVFKYLSQEENVEALSIEETMKAMGISLGDKDRAVYFDEYINGTMISDIMPIGKETDNHDYVVSFIKISEYNKLREFNGKDPIELKENEVLISSNFSKVIPTIKAYREKNKTISLQGKQYEVKNQDIIEENLRTDFMKNNIMTIIINDGYCDGAEKISSNMNIFFDENNKAEAEKTFIKEIREYQSFGKVGDYERIGYAIVNTRNEIFEGNKGVTTLVLFIVIYLGIVFLVSSMAVLALQQLSEASDSSERYVSLRRLGASKKSINKSIFLQMLSYFSIPILLAFVHSIVGVKVTSKFIQMYNRPNIYASSIITLVLFVTVYGVYFYTTYIGYKNIIKSKL